MLDIYYKYRNTLRCCPLPFSSPSMSSPFFLPFVGGNVRLSCHRERVVLGSLDVCREAMVGNSIDAFLVHSERTNFTLEALFTYSPDIKMAVHALCRSIKMDFCKSVWNSCNKISGTCWKCDVNPVYLECNGIYPAFHFILRICSAKKISVWSIDDKTKVFSGGFIKSLDNRDDRSNGSLWVWVLSGFEVQ